MFPNLVLKSSFCYNHTNEKREVRSLIMHCLENIQRISYPADLVMDLTKLYCFKGKDFFYEDIFKQDLDTIVKDTIERDAFFAARVLNLQITENRLRLIIRKNATPKTKDEKVLSNLKEVFGIIQKKGTDLELTSNEFLALITRIFSETKDIGYGFETVEVQVNLLREKKKRTLRAKFDDLLTLYKRHQKSGQIEATQLATNLYIDLMNLKVFTVENDFINLLIYYSLLFKERFNVFKYVSFFELYYEHEEEFKSATVAASFNWETGFSQTAILNRLTIQVMLEGYNQIEQKTDEFNFDKRIRKIDNVESTILKLGEIFTKDEIRTKHPYFSDSTINRALESLKKQNKIRPNGTGRSATWIRMVEETTFDPRNRQISLFEYIMDEEDE